MADDKLPDPDSLATWAKKYHLAHRAAVESLLRPVDLGTTQWAVLVLLASEGPLVQRDVARTLHVERATLSTIVTALVRKGLVEQRAHDVDQRQRVLELTAAGRKLEQELPDPLALSEQRSFDGIPAEDLAFAASVLRRATQRLLDLAPQEGPA